MRKLQPVIDKRKKTIDPYLDSDQYPMPDPDATPEQKASMPYALKMATCMWSDFITGRYNFPFNTGSFSSLSMDEGGQWDFPILRAYADGNQPVQKYKTMMGFNKNPDQAQASRKGKQQLSWAIKSPARRYVDGIKGAMSGIKHTVMVSAVDNFSDEDRNIRKFRNIALKKNAQYHKNNAALGGQPVYPEVKFSDEEELDMIMKTDPKFAQFHAVALKEVLMYSMNELSNFPELEAEMLEDAIVIGQVSARTIVDNRTNKTSAEYIDPETLLLPSSRYRDYRDIGRCGHVGFINFVDLCREAKMKGPDAPTWDELKKIAIMFSGNILDPNSEIFNNINWNNTGKIFGGTILDKIIIPVLYFDWKSWNRERRITRKREGNMDYAKRVDTDYLPNKDKKLGPVDGKNINIIDTDHECWYYGKWVIGSDTMIDWGKVAFTETYDNGKTVCRYKNYKCSKKSIISQMIPTLDLKQIRWLKFQDACIKAMPPGMDINFSALHGITDELGKVMHPATIIKNKMQTGIGMYAQTFNKNDPRYGASQGKPFEYNPGGLGGLIEEYEQADLMLTADLSSLTGITENMLGTEAKPNQLVGVTEQLISGTHNRLQPIYNAVFQTKKSLVEGMAVHIQDLAKFVPEDGTFYPEVSNLKIQALRIGKNAKKYKFGIEVRVTASDTMKQVTMAGIAESTAKGILSNSDALRAYQMIENGFYEEAIEYLSYKEQKAAEGAMDKEKAMIEANAQANSQAAQNSGQMKQAEIDAQTKSKEMIEKLSAQLQMVIDNNDRNNQLVIDDNKAKNDLISQHQQIQGDKEIQKEKPKTTTKAA